MSARVKVLLAVIGLVAVAVAAPFAYGWVTQHLKVGLDAGDDPYAGVTIVHRQLPPSTVPDEWARRLEQQAGEDLGLTVRQDWRPGRGDGSWLRGVAFQRQLAKAVTIPDPRDYRVMGVLTNADDPAAVAAHGAIYLVWFQTPVDSDHWIRSHPKVFTDARQEKHHTTWWAGFDVVSYAPPASGKDLTDVVDHWVRSVTACPDTAEGCVIPQHIATAGAKP
ncbi:hypothetical protein [Nocardioides jejuensis]|uniref:Uncharacterized protein n=1 Tax=Nocardioides jejuensis TaxID=2502782 RepID=A0A4R1BVA8_9ACTN|nr:hypothetical protein [Nocardioides jejuensis]TCJ21904.1 hypothetical protein EPD65_14045 [Nocardioides jejuensis]